jgi:hypothetical protein
MKSNPTYLLALAGLASLGANDYKEAGTPRKRIQRSGPSPEELEKAERERNIKRGLTGFVYGIENPVIIWARDQKNADRKARNKGLIN